MKLKWGQFQVQVWFATSSGYRTARVTESFKEALREARSYTSDARGVVIRNHDDQVIEIVKGEIVPDQEAK